MRPEAGHGTETGSRAGSARYRYAFRKGVACANSNFADIDWYDVAGRYVRWDHLRLRCLGGAVEHSGIEPLAFAMPWRRSTN